jgi:hypothetical protein
MARDNADLKGIADESHIALPCCSFNATAADCKEGLSCAGDMPQQRHKPPHASAAALDLSASDITDGENLVYTWLPCTCQGEMRRELLAGGRELLAGGREDRTAQLTSNPLPILPCAAQCAI